MLKFLFFIFLFIPFFSFADTYTGFSGAAKAAADFYTDVWTFLDNDVPSFFERMVAYLIEQFTYIRIAAQLESMKVAWGVSKAIMENFQIASKVASAADSLPSDVKTALVQSRVFDGFNIVIQALIARYVMRIM